MHWRCSAMTLKTPDFLAGIPGLPSPSPYEMKLSACIAGPTMAMIALKCPDIQVAVVDLNQQRIDAWNSECLPIYEPGLHEVVKACRGRNLIFSTDCRRHVAEADIIFVRYSRIPCPGRLHEPHSNLTHTPNQRAFCVPLIKFSDWPCSVNTPTKMTGVGAGKAADLAYWEGAARMIASVSTTSKIIVEKSTVPVKTAEAIGKVGHTFQTAS